MGDKLPNAMIVHLPSNLTKSNIYQKLVYEMKRRGRSNVLSQSHFFEIWKKHFSHVTIPKENRFSKCDVCSMVKRELEKTMAQDKREELKKILTEHNQLQMEQRHRYHSIRERAETDRSIMSIIVDGMDQNSTNLPHLKRFNKSAANLWHLKTHVTGAIVHGHGAYVYTDLLQWPHDPNLTINILVEVLLKEMLHYSKSKIPLPKKLHVQLDNCNRENKNRYVLGFLALLVQEKLFDEVELGFLMVGHTHEDIDALFGNFSQWLKRNDAFTLPDMFDGLKAANQSVQEVLQIGKMYDIKSWLDPVLEKLHNHSNPHIFKFLRDTNGVSRMLYKNWSEDKQWLPENSLGVYLLKGSPNSKPELVQPNQEKLDLPHLKHDMPKYKLSNMTQEALQWWNTFIEQFGESIDNSALATTNSWIFQELVEVIAENCTMSSSGTDDRPEGINNSLVQLRVAETNDIPEVYTGNYRPKKKASQPKIKVTKKKHKDQTNEDRNTENFIAFEHEKWSDKPLIGKVVKVDDAVTTIHWWLGKYRGPWKACMDDPYIEDIPNNNIVHKFSWNTIATNCRLPKDSVKDIKDAYKTSNFTF